MSFIKKLLPFLFKEKAETKSKTNPASPKTSGPKPSGPKPSHPKSNSPRPQANGNGNTSDRPREEREEREPGPIVGYAIIAKNKNHRGLRKGSKVYIRQILEDGERLRVRATSPSGKKITLTLNRQALSDYQSEGVPEHLAKHYSPDSIFQDEHEAKVKAEVLGKR